MSKKPKAKAKKPAPGKPAPVKPTAERSSKAPASATSTPAPAVAPASAPASERKSVRVRSVPSPALVLMIPKAPAAPSLEELVAEAVAEPATEAELAEVAEAEASVDEPTVDASEVTETEAEVEDTAGRALATSADEAEDAVLEDVATNVFQAAPANAQDDDDGRATTVFVAPSAPQPSDEPAKVDDMPVSDLRAPATISGGAAPSSTGHRVLHTRACDLFGVEYPIVQTGMGWVSGPRLTAATSAAGGLGILAAATMTFDELVQAIRSVKSKTDKPFGVNLRADQADAEQRCDLLVREKVRVASFAQAPGERLIKKLKDAGLVVMPTIGARRHAEKVAKWGVDAVIAQGHEGGGHTGTVPTSLLIQDVCRAVDIPVIGAGGFSSGQGLVAALAYGASGIAMGTRFLLTQESQVPSHVKARYLKAGVNDTVVTKAVDGYPQRVIRTEMIDALEKAGPVKQLPLAVVNALSLMRVTGTKLADLVKEGLAMRRNQELTWAQLAMAANAPMLTKAAMVDGKAEAGILPTGQVVGVIDELPTVAELVTRVMREAEATLDRLSV